MNTFSAALRSGIRLICPACRAESPFRTTLQMHARCSRCGYAHEREDGYFIGAIYVNMAPAPLFAAGGCYLSVRLIEPRLLSQVILWGLFALGFPVLFFRASRGLWMNPGYYITGQAGSHEAPGKGISGEEK